MPRLLVTRASASQQRSHSSSSLQVGAVAISKPAAVCCLISIFTERWCFPSHPAGTSAIRATWATLLLRACAVQQLCYSCAAVGCQPPEALSGCHAAEVHPGTVGLCSCDSDWRLAGGIWKVHWLGLKECLVSSQWGLSCQHTGQQVLDEDMEATLPESASMYPLLQPPWPADALQIWVGLEADSGNHHLLGVVPYDGSQPSSLDLLVVPWSLLSVELALLLVACISKLLYAAKAAGKAASAQSVGMLRDAFEHQACNPTLLSAICRELP